MKTLVFLALLCLAVTSVISACVGLSEATEHYSSRALAYTCLGMEAEAQQDINRAVELGFDRTLLERRGREL